MPAPITNPRELRHAEPRYTFNQPVNQNGRTVTHPERHRMRPRRYATDPDPTTPGELLLQAIKAGA